jgi:hypothetical protein
MHVACGNPVRQALKKSTSFSLQEHTELYLEQNCRQNFHNINKHKCDVLLINSRIVSGMACLMFTYFM